MVTPEILAYIRYQMTLGVSQDKIRYSLITSGWDVNDIQDAFEQLTREPSGISFEPNFQVKAYTEPGLDGPLRLLQQAIVLYVRKIGLFFLCMVFCVISLLLPCAIIFYIYAVLKIPDAGSLIIRFGLSTTYLWGVFLLLTTILGIVLASWSYTTFLYILTAEVTESFWEFLKKGFTKIFSFWWVSFLSLFITLGGLLLFIIPGIIFSIWFSLLHLTLLEDADGGLSALLRAKAYMKGKLFSIILHLFSLLFFTTIFSLPFGLFFLILDAQKIPFASIITLLIVFIFVMPFFQSYLFSLFSNLRSIKGDVIQKPTTGGKFFLGTIGLLGFLMLTFILPAVFILQVDPVNLIAKSNDTTRSLHLERIQTALKGYFLEKGSYPFSLQQLAPSYLSGEVFDPKTKQPYHYVQANNGAKYTLCAEYEKTQKRCLNEENHINLRTNEIQERKK